MELTARDPERYSQHMKLPCLLAAASLLVAAAPVPDSARLRGSVETLVSFGTRHTLSSATDPQRGIGAARRWTATQFERVGVDCGGCLRIETIGDTFTGPRAPGGVRVENVLAVQLGTTEPERVVIVQGHIDSRVTDVMDATSDAPGANDDASGVALVLEAARILSREKFPATIVYAALSGEEQGLWGGQLLARTTKARDWQVTAVLNNDIVGNTHGVDGAKDAKRVRVFSEGARLSADLDALRAQRANGGENDSPSRALAKAIRRVAQRENRLEVIAVHRPDRFQRGGDQTPFLELGYPAVRFSEVTENYDHQHQTLRTENGKFFGDTIQFMDFPYLAKVTALNIASIRELASAPAAPTGVTISGALSADTVVTWSAVPGAARYRVRWRQADQADWTQARDVSGKETTVSMRGINIDHHFFGVSAVSKTGAESVVTFAGPAPRR